MCGLKVGDEVVAVLDLGDAEGLASPPVGWIGVVTWVAPHPFFPEVWGISLDNWPLPGNNRHSAARFRKVQRRDLTEWLATENTIEEPRRAPAKKRERAQ